MSDRVARAILGLAGAAVLWGVWTLDLPARTGHQFWSDGSTYYSMAWSLAEDLDLRYEARDLLRVERRYGGRPLGIFLKRTDGGLSWHGDFPWLYREPVAAEDRPVYFAKAFAYPVYAAPFVAALGNRGFLVANALALLLAVYLALLELRRHASPAAALAATLALYLASVTPLYVLWLTPEIFNVGVIAAGLFAWRRDRPLLSALLLGIAVYSKPYNLWLTIPLGFGPLLHRDLGGLIKGLRESCRRGLMLFGTVGLLFGLNAAITGELNYQGGERKTFYRCFPFEPSRAATGEPKPVTFGNCGQWMTTEHAGPALEGQDEQIARAGVLRDPAEMRPSLLRNLVYFWVGRYGGALPYYGAAFAALCVFLLWGPRTRGGWLAVTALLVSYLFYVKMIPDNWYGGGGTVGNRYFLNLLPLAPFFVPRGRAWLVAALGIGVGIVFIAPALIAPLTHSMRPGLHATRDVYRVLPAELSMLNDLSAFTEPWRKKRPVGDTEGDPWRNWPADPKAYYLYFPDDGTHGLEGDEDQRGFWLKGGHRAEVILRALEPVTHMVFEVTAGPSGDEVSLGVGGQEQRLLLAASETAELGFATSPGFKYYDTFVHVVRLRSHRANGASEDRRHGSFVRVSLEVERRARPAKE